MNIVTCIAPVNIAVIKYWGKRDEKLILPLNDSVSTTLSTDEMHAKTTIMASSEFTEDRMWLNGKEESFDNPRLKICLQEMQRLAQQQGSCQNGLSTWHIRICSVNNFPTAAGLASSAAGYACLVHTLKELYSIHGDVTAIARQGSGSACRSLLGGFVRWHKGSAADGSDSVAKQIAPTSHWPELRILILVVSTRKKLTSSTSGMQRSVQTSELLKYRVEHCVPVRVEAMIEAIEKKDFGKFGELTMRDSNQFHATCLDTYPPASYMNDTSHTIAHIVHRYNAVRGALKVAYTFDAGPNACLYMLESEVPAVVSLMKHAFPHSPENLDYVKGLAVDTKAALPQDLLSSLCVEPQPIDSLQYMILTKPGEGPQRLTDPDCHLLSREGLPK